MSEICAACSFQMLLFLYVISHCPLCKMFVWVVVIDKIDDLIERLMVTHFVLHLALASVLGAHAAVKQKNGYLYLQPFHNLLLYSLNAMIPAAMYCLFLTCRCIEFYILINSSMVLIMGIIIIIKYQIKSEVVWF